MFLGDEKKTVSVMLYTSKKLRELWAQLRDQVETMDERFEEINDRLEKYRKKFNEIINSADK